MKLLPLGRSSSPNLIVLSRSDHMSLHRYLGDKRVILEKNILDYENNWKEYMIYLTMKWIDNKHTIKLWECVHD